MSGQCEVCGKRLTMFNRAWGTNKCSPCAKGRSAAAKSRAVTDALERAPFASEEDIGKSGRFGTLVGALVLLFCVDIVAFVCHLIVAIRGLGFFYLCEIATLYLGIKVVGGSLFGNRSLLTVRRWQSCWHADVFGYIVGHVLARIVISSQMAYQVQQGLPTEWHPDPTVTLATFALVPATALVFALVNGVWADRRNIRKTRESFREWRNLQSRQAGNA